VRGSLDSDLNEEWAFTLDVAGQKKCLVFFTPDVGPWTSPAGTVMWETDFSTDENEFRVGIEVWEKVASGPLCEFEAGDNRNNYLRFYQVFDGLQQLPPNEPQQRGVDALFTQNPCRVWIYSTIVRKAPVWWRTIPSIPQPLTARLQQRTSRCNTRTRRIYTYSPAVLGSLRPPSGWSLALRRCGSPSTATT
jgi:hypothetical protein